MGVKLSEKRYEEIKKIVVDMFEKYDISCVPISGFEIAAKMGIKVIPYSAYPESAQRLMRKESTDGFSILKDTDEWVVFYDDSVNYLRVNNTIMHEIGHIVLDHTEDSALAEKEVNFFAKYALAPPVLIHKLKLNRAMDISNRFKISYEAACYAFNYYQKWLQHGGRFYKDYELHLLRQFDAVG